MKKLICANDIKSAAERGQSEFHLEIGTIVTPSAKDLAKELGVKLRMDSAVAKNLGPNFSGLEESGKQDAVFDRDMVYQTIKMVLTNHLLAGGVEPSSKPPFLSEGEAKSGLKIVRGRTVCYEDFDTGEPGTKVAYREVIGKSESQMSVGFLTIEKSSFQCKASNEEIHMVLEGSLAITINGETFEASQGDMLHVPKGSQVRWSSSGYVKIFYVSYPEKWT